MHLSVYVPLLVSVLLAGVVPLIARLPSPPAAARAVTAAACVAAAGSTWGLGLLAVTLLTHTPVAEANSRRLHVRDTNPVLPAVAVLSVVLLTLTLRRAIVTARAHAGTQRSLRRLCALCAGGELAIVPHPSPVAVAVPGRPGRILISTAMLSLLPAAEQGVLFAHERAHLHYHHHRLLWAVHLAASLNPFLGSARARVAFLLERWADEEAAGAVASRPLAALALARAALVTNTGPRRRAAFSLGGVLAFDGLEVTRRVLALQDAAPRPATGRHHALVTLLAVTVLVSGAAAADATLAAGRLLVPALGLPI